MVGGWIPVHNVDRISLYPSNQLPLGHEQSKYSSVQNTRSYRI